MIISLTDTATSFLGGFTIFSILGHLAHESGKSVADVVTAGTGLAFVSYPDAIAKFQAVPQVLIKTKEGFSRKSKFVICGFSCFARVF